MQCRPVLWILMPKKDLGGWATVAVGSQLGLSATARTVVVQPPGGGVVTVGDAVDEPNRDSGSIKTPGGNGRAARRPDNS